MSSVLEEFLVRFGFDVKTEGLDRMVSRLNATKSLLTTIREPFHAFNEAHAALNTLGHMALAPFKALIGISNEAAGAARSLGELSTALGVGAEQLSFFGHVANQNGSDSHSMNQALTFLNRQLAEAGQGGKTAIEAFGKFGINVRNADGTLRQAGPVMEDALAHLSGIADEGQRTALAMEIFGNAGLRIRGVLGVTTDQLRDLRMEFELLGGRTPEKLTALGSAFGDSSNRIRMFGRGLSNWFAMGFQPILNGFLKWIEEFALKWGPTLRLVLYNIGESMYQVAKVIGAGADTFAQAFGFIIRNLDVLLPLFALLEYRAVGAALKTAASWLLAVAPFVLAFLAIEDLFAFLEGKESVIGDIAELWEEWTGKMSSSHPILAGIMQTVTEIFSGALATVRAFWAALSEDGIFGLLKEIGTSLGVAFNFYKDIIVGFITSMLDAVGGFASKLIDRTLGPVRAAMSALGLGGGSAPQVQPSTAAVAGSTTSVNSSSTNANASITVNSQPGMNERALAQHTAREFKELFKSELRGAHPDVAYAR
jgi:hypothetical protein